jgi:hypothetical protein
MGQGRKVYKILWESPKERDHSEDRYVYVRIGAKLILRRLAGRLFSGFTCLWIGTDSGLL